MICRIFHSTQWGFARKPTSLLLCVCVAKWAATEWFLLGMEEAVLIGYDLWIY
jgi:hypothetical protein